MEKMIDGRQNINGDSWNNRRSDNIPSESSLWAG